MFQQVKAQTFLKWIERKSQQRNKRGKGSDGHFRTEKYSKWKKNPWMGSIAEWKRQRKEPMNMKVDK